MILHQSLIEGMLFSFVFSLSLLPFFFSPYFSFFSLSCFFCSISLSPSFFLCPDLSPLTPWLAAVVVKRAHVGDVLKALRCLALHESV